MPLPQPKFREIVLQLLYSYDMGHAVAEDMITLLMTELEVTKQSVVRADERVQQIRKRLPELDAQIAEVSQSYAFERIQSVERNVLRLGVYELLYDDTIPKKVAIAEALRLARKFGSPEAVAFVNAVLDTIAKKKD